MLAQRRMSSLDGFLSIHGFCSNRRRLSVGPTGGDIGLEGNSLLMIVARRHVIGRRGRERSV